MNTTDLRPKNSSLERSSYKGTYRRGVVNGPSRLISYCSSDPCASKSKKASKSPYSDIPVGAVEVEAKRGDIDCPHCGFALFWKRVRHGTES